MQGEVNKSSSTEGPISNCLQGSSYPLKVSSLKSTVKLILIPLIAVTRGSLMNTGKDPSLFTIHSGKLGPSQPKVRLAEIKAAERIGRQHTRVSSEKKQRIILRNRRQRVYIMKVTEARSNTTSMDFAWSHNLIKKRRAIKIIDSSRH